MQCFDRLITVCIVHNRYLKPLLPCPAYRRNDRFNMRRWRDKVDVVCAFRLQMKHQRGKFIRTPFSADRSMVDFMVLTKQAIQVAAAKENCA